MDKLNQKLLLELMKNSRTPTTVLAKKLKSSREVINYRINKLKKDKIIIDFITEINLEKLGYIGAAVFLAIKAKTDKEFKNYINNSPYVSWVAEHAGIWNYGLSIYGKNNEEVDKRFLELYNKFKEDIIDHRFTFHKRNHFFYEKYFSSLPLTKKQKEKFYKIDKHDKLILKELSLNSRLDSVQLTKKVPLTAQAIRNRIRNLEQANIIQKYSLFVDVSKLNSFQYSIFISNKNIKDKKRLLAYLSEHPKVSFIAEYLGDPFLEFGVFINDPYKLREILQEIEEEFPDNRILEVSLFLQEFVSIGPAKCVFD